MPAATRRRTDEPRPGSGLAAPQAAGPGTEVAVPTPAEMVRRYAQSLAAVLPSHIAADAWLRLATNSLRRGRRVSVGSGTMYELELAASNDPLQWIATLIECARLGLTPGSDQFYITARKTKGVLKILGIVGYIGYLDLIHRAGAVSSVTAEVVRESDTFVWRKGSIDANVPPRWHGAQRVPYHEFDAFGTDADRGKIVGAYMYCDMKDGSVSRVTTINRDDIARSQAASASYGSEHSPWDSDEAAMVLKTVLRKGRKFVPTSPEYRMEALRAEAAVQREYEAIGVATPPAAIAAAANEEPMVGDVMAVGDGDQWEAVDTGGADPDNDAAQTWPPTPTIPGTTDSKE